MATIDSDAHVIETERTWEYMTQAERAYRPQVVHARADEDAITEWWLIDGAVRGKQINVGADTPPASREMADVAARLRHMDELGVDVQVLYPSVFLTPLTHRVEVELALCRSYNRWLADIWAQGHGRLLWAMVLPLMSMESALGELAWAKDHGACAVFIRGLEGDHQLIDPYFFPLYESASDLDLPICVHSATGSFQHYGLFDGESGFSRFKLPNVGAFHALVMSKVPARFPRLRWGFIEVSAQWVPYVIHDLARRYEKRGERLSPDLMRDYRLYVACQTDDDLPYVLKYAGEDNLVIGSDYGHADTATEIEALRRLKEQTDIAPAAIDKILDDNARALYGL
jgi:predicted TIM-barrel fold metal-dependent hydrolase